MSDDAGPRRVSVVEFSILVSAPCARVWEAIVDPDITPQWMGGFRFLSTWEVGGPFTVSGTLNGREHREEGTLLAFQPGELLRYHHWSRLWRVPDLPTNRAVLEIRLRPIEGVTELLFKHQLPIVEALAQHSRFFWGVSLGVLRELVEG